MIDVLETQSYIGCFSEETMTPFAGFTNDIFAAYAPEKWSSMVHNLPRMRAKETIVAFCEAAAQGLEEPLKGLIRASSDEIPNIVNQKKVDAQWVYWFRDAAARASLASFLEKTTLDQAVIFNIAPQDKHATLAVVVRQKEIWVGLRLHPGASVDRKNIASKLAKAWERERFVALLKELPEGAMIGYDGSMQSTAEITPEILEQWSTKMGADQPTWSVGMSIPAETALSLGLELVPMVNRWLSAIVPFYRFSAWTRENDLIEATKQLQEEKQQKRRNATSFSPGDKVRIVSGLFSGKIGTVQETDTKAQVKVLVGKMSVVVASTELATAS